MKRAYILDTAVSCTCGELLKEETRMLGRGSRCDAPLRIPQVPSAPSRPLGVGLAHGGLGDGVSALWRVFAPVRLPGADTGGLGGSPVRSPSPFMFVCP